MIAQRIDSSVESRQVEHRPFKNSLITGKSLIPRSTVSMSRCLFFAMAVFLTLAPAGLAQNLLTNPGFESGTTTGWMHWEFTLSLAGRMVHSGRYSSLSTDRVWRYQGPRQSVLGLMEDGKTYRIAGWVRLENAGRDSIGVTVRQIDARGTTYYRVNWTTGYSDRWVELSGYFTLHVVGQLTSLQIYFEGPTPGVNFYMDDALVAEQSVDWRDVVNEQIEQIRKRNAQITVLSPLGQPVRGMEVQVRQTKHRFAFGSAINRKLLTNSRFNQYGDFFRDHFEWAVLENESKWYHNEPQQGYVTYDDADRIYNWCNGNGITMRGHCLYWAGENAVQSWVKTLPYAPLPADSELWTAVENRMDSAVNHFKNKFLHWDINNEMLAGSFYKDRLGEAIRVWMFQRAHEIDPHCKLFVNDYRVISGGENLGKYKDQITWLLENGAPVHGIGVQCHIGTGYGRWGVIDRFDTLSEMDLPIWVTEFDVDQPDEYIRADDLEDFYRIAFSRPAVEGILMWGFWQDSHWRPNWYIVNSDWSLNEAGRRYEALMDEWTTRCDDTTDANGQITFRGFHGAYEITVTPPAAEGTTQTIELEPGPETARFSLQLNHVAEPLNCREVVDFGLRMASDVNGDCHVDFGDLELLAACWLGDTQRLVNFGCADLSTTERVQFSDFAILAAQWLQCNDPENQNCTANW